MKKFFVYVFLLILGYGAVGQTQEVEAKTKDNNIVISQIEGTLDKPNEELILKSLNEAKKNNSKLIVLQFNVSNIANFNKQKISKSISLSKIPVVIWFGPKETNSYSNFRKPLINVIKSADFFGFASFDKTKLKKQVNNPTLRGFIISLNNKKVDGNILVTAKKVIDNEKTKEQVDATPIFYKLSISQQIRHSLIRSWIVVLFICLGALLIMFEYYSASIGLAGLVGLIMILGGVYGASQLNSNWLFLVLCAGVAVSVFDVQAGGLGFWSFLSFISILIGGRFFVPTDLQPNWILLALILIGFVIFVGGAIPSMMRTRFGTSTIGREDLLGKKGVAVEDISPFGLINVKNAKWKARTNHATPILKGEECIVTSIEGLELIVDPLEGAAKDYRK